MGFRTKVGRAVAPLTTSRFTQPMMKRLVPPLDVVVGRVTRGRVRVSDLMVPTLSLTHTGRRSGRSRSTVLATLPDADGFFVIGSNWGQPSHPAWALNIVDRPEVEVEFRGRRVPMRARLLHDAERSEAWERMNQRWPGFERYVETAEGRVLRVFRLEPR